MLVTQAAVFSTLIADNIFCFWQLKSQTRKLASFRLVASCWAESGGARYFGMLKADCSLSTEGRRTAAITPTRTLTPVLRPLFVLTAVVNLASARAR